MTVQTLQIPISYSGHPDKFIWPHTKSGEHSVKTGHRLANSSTTAPSLSNSNLFNELWSTLRSALIPQKEIKLFLWKLCNKAIPVKANHYRRRVVTSPFMPNMQSAERISGTCNASLPLDGSGLVWISAPMCC